MVAVIVGLCWALFALVWLVGAAYNARRGPAARTRRPWVPNVLGAVIAVWVLLQLLPIDLSSLRVGGPWIRVLGVAVLVPATAFTLWARVVLGTMWSSTPTAKQGHELRTDGPYTITRHPIYTGMLGMVTGTALAARLGRWIPVLVAAAVIVELKIRAEEQLLMETFPDRYPQFRSRVPQLIPGLHRVWRPLRQQP